MYTGDEMQNFASNIVSFVTMVANNIQERQQQLSAGMQKVSVLMFICFVLLLILFVYRAKKRPNKFNLSTVAIFCLFLLGSVVCVLGYHGRGLLIIFAACFVLFIHMLLTGKDLNIEITEQVKTVDVSEPIRIKDFFIGWGLLLKLKRKYGPRKAITINLALGLGLALLLLPLILYAVNVWVFDDQLWHILPGMLGGSFGGLIGSYIGMKRALKVHEISSSPQILKNNYCIYCGAMVTSDAIFCTNCGKQLLNNNL